MALIMGYGMKMIARNISSLLVKIEALDRVGGLSEEEILQQRDRRKLDEYVYWDSVRSRGKQKKHRRGGLWYEKQED